MALVLQVAIFYPSGPLPFLRGHELAVHVASYGVLGAFLAFNRHLPGLALVALGFASNAVAIVANGGLMPASEEALRAAGRWATIQEAGLSYNNSTVIGPHTRLWFLGDVFAVPAGLPLANVFSVGDVLLAVGAFVLVPSLMGARPLGARETVVAGAAVGFLAGLLVGTVRVPSALQTASAPPPRAAEPVLSTDRPPSTTPVAVVRPGPAPAPPSSKSSGPTYTVQVGAFRQRQNAEALVRRLRAQGYDARLVAGSWARVWVGRFHDEALAVRLAEDLARAGYPVFVRRAP